MGFFSFSKIRNPRRCAFYISKYITECPIKSNTNYLYFCSHGLARAEVFDLSRSPEDLSVLKKFWGFDNEYVKIKDFSYEKIPQDIQLFLFSKKDLDFFCRIFNCTKEDFMYKIKVLCKVGDTKF